MRTLKRSRGSEVCLAEIEAEYAEGILVEEDYVKAKDEFFQKHPGSRSKHQKSKLASASPTTG